MEFNFTWKRVGFLLVLLLAFALLGGFTPPFQDQGLETGAFTRRAYRAWFICILMSVTGATMITVADHWVGMLPPSNWRPF